MTILDLPMQGKQFKRSIRQKVFKTMRDSGDRRQIAQKYSINHRPEAVNKRHEFGHWELDGVEGPRKSLKALLLTFVERKTRFQIAIRPPSKSATDVLKAIKEFHSRVGTNVKSITTDNGHEFINGPVVNYILNNFGDLYIANSYAPYERGTNERLNRNLRAPWYFPKGTVFTKVTQAQVDAVVDEINAKPLTHTFRVIKTPSQAFRLECRLANRKTS